VLGSIDLERLKLFVAFGSIIARTGLSGEADYALANGWLTRLTERLQRQCPHARCLSIEWSVWSGVGMGERLGRVDTLIQQGVTPIGPDEGVATFERLLRARSPRASIIVSGRFGALPTLEVEQPELPLMRYLERPRVYFPGIELVADSDLSLETDPYLDDHVFGGERLLPAVMGLEAMAQAALALTGRSRVASFEEVRFDRPVVIAAGDKSTIRIVALVRGPDRVELALRCKDTEFQVNHFHAVCVTANGATSAGAEHEPEPSGNGSIRRDALPIREAQSRNDSGPREATAELVAMRSGGNGSGAPQESESQQEGMIALDPERDLYDGILFQRGRFRRLRGYRELRAYQCVADISADGGGDWFGRYQPQALVLGDPGARDSALHAIQACIPHAVLLPVGADRVSFTAPWQAGPRFITAREIAREGATLVYDVEVRGADGTICERWERLRLRIVGERQPIAPWTPALLVPYLERRVDDLLPGSQLAMVLHHGTGMDRRLESDAAIRHLIGERGVIHHRPDGRPEVNGGPCVSAAHGGAFTLAVSGPGPIGCDLEPVVHRPAQSWRDLLGAERATMAEVIARESGESYDVSATRVWAAGECLKKAGASPGGPLSVDAKAPDGWLMLASGRLRIATVNVEVREAQSPLVIAILIEDHSHSCESTSIDTSSGSKKPTWSGTSTTSTT
jgi:enediyne polyketide synthase